MFWIKQSNICLWYGVTPLLAINGVSVVSTSKKGYTDSAIDLCRVISKLI